jgi:hypothetical protein
MVDAFVLDLLERRTFTKAEFIETSDGHCRLRAPLTHELAETLPRWSQAVALLAEHVANTLGQAMAGKYLPVTPLTRRRTRSAQAQVKARKGVGGSSASVAKSRQRAAASRKTAPWSCPECGAPVEDSGHVRCDACIAKDPRQTPELRGRRGAAIAARRRAQEEWEQNHPDAPFDEERFRRYILPGLQQATLAQIMAATGFSKSFASAVRRGRYVPHVSTWPALAELAKG